MRKNVPNGTSGRNGQYVQVHVEAEPVQPDENVLAVIAVKMAVAVMNSVSRRVTWIHVFIGLSGTTGLAVSLFVKIEIVSMRKCVLWQQKDNVITDIEIVSMAKLVRLDARAVERNQNRAQTSHFVTNGLNGINGLIAVKLVSPSMVKTASEFDHVVAIA